MTIVMGWDQHRAQITTEWVDTVTGEIGRARVAPAHRESVRRFLGRFAGQELEVALEATTGWRFVVEELSAVGAGVHLGEPAQTSALRRQPGCRALMGHYGIGELTSVVILAELGDCRRFSCSRQAVRYAGLDITV